MKILDQKWRKSENDEELLKAALLMLL